MPATLRSRVTADKMISEGSTSFKGTLAKFQYKTAAKNEDENSAAPRKPSSSPLKRAREDEGAASHSPGKKRRQISRYAAPSRYAHLKGLEDILAPDLICVFVGFNPGVKTAQTGFPYAHPSNLFWKLLHSSGITDRRWRPDEAPKLPTIGCGNTNLVDRPTKNAGELSKQERAAGAPVLAEKVRIYRPEAVLIVGKSIWEDIWRYKYGRNPRKDEFRYGWQDDEERMGKVGEAEQEGGGETWKGARVYVTTSTSGLSAGLKPAEKEAIWKPFGGWVQQRRRERGMS